MKKIIFIFALVLLILCPGCQKRVYYSYPDPVFYDEVDVEITDIDKRHWFASTHFYTVILTVENKELGLCKRFEAAGTGAFGAPKEYGYNRGDIVQAKVSYRIGESGEKYYKDICELY